MIQVSVFRSARDNAPRMLQYESWDQLVSELGTHRIQPGGDKLAQPALSPAEYPPGAARASASVRRVHFVMLDFDKLSGPQFEEVLKIAEGTECLLYTTWSHPARHAEDGSWSFRLVMPLTRPVEAHEWKRFFGRLRARYGNLPDEKCKDAARIYFGPASPSPDGNIIERQHGAPINVDTILADPEPATAEKTSRKVGRQDLESLAASLVRKPAAKETGKALRLLLQGKPFATPGERDEVMFRIACSVADRWNDVDPASVATLAAPSITAMQAEEKDCPGVDIFEDKIRRAVQKLEEEQRRLAQERQNAVSANILDAFDGTRSDPYSPDELESFARAAGVPRMAFQRRWILQLNRSFYIYKNGQYMPPTHWDTLCTRATRDLAPAVSAGVNVWKVTQGGDPRPKTQQELMVEYGTVVEKAIADLNAHKSYYDPKRCAVVEAPCAPRELEPERVPAVERWLELFAGDEHDTLLDWIAACGWLDQPSAALYLDGRPGVGKSMLAHGLARLWTQEGPVPLDDIVGSFNDAILRCPLVFGDEVLPDLLRKSESTGFLRRLIQARDHTLKRKFMPSATVVGAVRLLLAANNQHMLDTYEALTPADIEAMSERIRYIKAQPEAASYLRSLGREGWVAMVQGDGIARHALWLRQVRRVDRNKRFLVSGKAGALHRALSTGQGLASAACHWCVGYLLEPGKMDHLGTLLVRVSKSRLLVHASALAKHWDMYPTNVKAPSAKSAQKALSAISKSKKIQMTAGGGRRTNYWEIDGELLLQWVNDNGYCTEEEILDGLTQDTAVEGMPDPDEEEGDDAVPF